MLIVSGLCEDLDLAELNVVVLVEDGDVAAPERRAARESVCGAQAQARHRGARIARAGRTLLRVHVDGGAVDAAACKQRY